MKLVSALTICAVITLSLLGTVNAATSANTSITFTYNETNFLLHGKPFQILAGQMDPQRIPQQYWRDRLQKVRAMGLNSISSYVFWDLLEPKEGHWDFSGMNDVAQYFKIAQEEGLKVLLRPGSYICGEHTWGGFPAWLLEVPGMVVRSHNEPFLNATKSYITRLAKELEPLLVTNGGPIILVQVENEYGSYGSDKQYTSTLRDMWKEAGFNVPLYTTDGDGTSYLKGGVIENVLAETDGGGGDVDGAYVTRQNYLVNTSSSGPFIDAEYYTTWLDLWGSPHQTTDSNGAKTVMSDLDWLIKNGSSFSLYMAHGGTNFGFSAGADWSTVLTPVTSSYDYGAPLDESGQPTELFYDIQKTIKANLPTGEKLPNMPKATTMISIANITMKPVARLFDTLPKPVTKQQPVNMESLGQSNGFTLYRTTSQSATSGMLELSDYPRDRILVYVNGKRQGLFDSTFPLPQAVNLTVSKNDTIDLLVENMGRINYGPRIPDQRKGIVGNVTLNGKMLEHWSMYPLPIDDPSTMIKAAKPSNHASDAPTFYQASFTLHTIGDTFLSTPGWTKGMAWVNGNNLGRYWMIGPQQQLYVPGCWLKKGTNEIIILELEQVNATSVSGIQTRSWANRPNPSVPQTVSN